MDVVTKKRKFSDLDEKISSNDWMDTVRQFYAARLFRKKNKIDFRDDHTYAKNIITDCVNHDCLAEIFMYVPACERPKVALVCKKWQRALNDSWFNVRKLELIHWEFHEQLNCLTKYPTIDGKLRFLKSLLDKCGRYLTKLDLTAYRHCNIVPVINDCCPNLVRLRLRFTSINNKMLRNAFTRLSKLHSLTIIFQNIKKNLLSNTLINSLKNVAGTLIRLNLLNWADELSDSPYVTKAIYNVIDDLKELKYLELAGVRISSKLLEELKYRQITYFNHTVYITKTLSITKPLINITSLKLFKCQLKDATLYTIANTFMYLEYLSVCGSRISDRGAVALTKMKNLKLLSFFGKSQMVTDSSIKLFKNMERIMVPFSKNITDASIIKVIENSPMINMLGVYDTNVTSELVKKAAEISKIRERSLILCIGVLPNIKQYESQYLKIYRLHEKNGKSCAYDDTSADTDIVFSQRVQEGKHKSREQAF